MLIYFSNVWAGTSDPLWPHIILLSVSIVAAFAVGAGILLERPKYSATAHCIANWLVLGGIAVESLCTISLFIFDERISQAQQRTIEQSLAYRHLSPEQTGRLITVTKKFPSLNFITFTVAENEAWGLGIEIGNLLRNNGWNWLPCAGPFNKLQSPYPGIPIFCWTIVGGIQIEGSQNRQEVAAALVEALKDPDVIGMENVRFEKSEAYPTIAIMVGTKR